MPSFEITTVLLQENVMMQCTGTLLFVTTNNLHFLPAQLLYCMWCKVTTSGCQIK